MRAVVIGYVSKREQSVSSYIEGLIDADMGGWENMPVPEKKDEFYDEYDGAGEDEDFGSDGV
jgi:broad specificity phosphatase PhoE